MSKALKIALKVVLTILVVVVVVFGGYVAYLMLTYDRIPDGESVPIENGLPATAELVPGEQYSVATYNIGFGAYTPDYTFFMDEGYMADGTYKVGVHSVAASKESVLACTQGAIDEVKALDPDFVMLQEVDTDSTRSYQVNQKEAFEQAFPDFASAFAVNFHSSFLAYPIHEMHGIVNAGLLVLSDSAVDSAVRRSYPVDEGFPTKFFDLDRCFLVEHIPVSNGHELVLINNHMSAYDEGGLIRAQQLKLLCDVLEKETGEGDYVIVGGDWNHALAGSVELYESQQLRPPWVFEFDESALPKGFSVVAADNLADVPTCRGDDIPYEKGVTYTTTVDGFIVSDNVKATAVNVDTGFAYSDHNPVLLTFELM